MSGGAYDYLCNRVNDMADSLSAKTHTPLRRAFAKHLQLVAAAMHDIEWVDSGDMSHPADEPAIRAALGDNAQHKELDVLIQDATELRDQLAKAIKECKQ